MKRLTFKTNIGAGVYKIGGYSGETIMPSDIREKVPKYADSIINALTKLAAYEDAEESGDILNRQNYTKLTVCNKATGEEIAVITNDEITTAHSDIVVALTPKYKGGDDICRN